MSKTIDDYKREFKNLLGERQSDGWVFGVCSTLARRSGWELWIVRSCALILLLTVTFWTGLAYFVLAMMFFETRPGAQAKLTRWAKRADDLLEALLRGLKGIMSAPAEARRAETTPTPPMASAGDKKAA